MLGCPKKRIVMHVRRQDLYFSKADELALRKLLRKVKSQADAHESAQPQQPQPRAPSSSSEAAKAASPGLRGGYGGDTESAAQADEGVAAVAAGAGESSSSSSSSAERDALNAIVRKYGLEPRDVEALLAWRHSHEF